MLFDAAQALENQPMARSAVNLALDQDVDWPNPDMTHGRAGLGAALLHLWESTRDDRLLNAAIRTGDSLLDTAELCGAHLYWQTPPGFPSVFSGRRFLGYAHGIAGIGQFFSALEKATGYLRFHQATADIVATLMSSGIRSRDEVDWPQQPSPEAPAVSYPYWCHGASGIGTFLVRRYADSRSEVLLPFIRGAAEAVLSARWKSGVGYCHGLAGNGDFLLDIAQALGDAAYLSGAWDIARVLMDRRVMHRSELTYADEAGAVTTSFGGGTGGILSFLLRLRFGGPRILMEIIPNTASTKEYRTGRQRPG